MQAPHVDCVKLSWTGNSAEIFSRKGIYFFFPRRKKFVAARYPNLKLFQSFYADHAIENYQTTRMLPEPKANSLHASQNLKRHFEVLIFSLPQIVFHCLVDKI